MKEGLDYGTPPGKTSRSRGAGAASMAARHGTDVELAVCAMVDVNESPAARKSARLLWDLLRYAIILHVAWVAAWVLLVALNGFNTVPKCGGACTLEDRVNEFLPWHTPDAFFFYVSLYVLVLLLTYYLAATRWLGGKQPMAMRALKLVAIVLLVPAYLRHAFWDHVIHWYANVSYIDFDPTHALLDRAPLHRPAALKLPNGTLVLLKPNDVVLVGNGPLSSEQRAFLRRSAPDQVYRFNGMTNLLPDEPVGHLFVRKIDDTYTRSRGSAIAPAGEYWGLTPPLSRQALIEWLYVPGVTVVRERTMCSRAVEAVSVILLNGTRRDARFYADKYGVPMRLLQCEGLCKAPPPSAGGSKAPGGWTSGFLGLLEVTYLKPHARMHLLGMNFGAAPNQQHATHVERRFVQMLIAQERVVLHLSPSQTYHSELAGNSEATHHLSFPFNFYLKDTRIQGMRCGEWNVWWAPEWQWSPQNYWMGVIPLPPFFHPGTSLHVADAEGHTLPDNYNPLNCTQHAEILMAHGGQMGRTTAKSTAKRHAAPAGRQLREVLKTFDEGLRRMIRVPLLYGPHLTSNVSVQLESLEDCKQRVTLIRRYDQANIFALNRRQGEESNRTKSRITNGTMRRRLMISTDRRYKSNN